MLLRTSKLSMCYATSPAMLQASYAMPAAATHLQALHTLQLLPQHLRNDTLCLTVQLRQQRLNNNSVLLTPPCRLLLLLLPGLLPLPVGLPAALPRA
jgi:hypothetical protein